MELSYTQREWEEVNRRLIAKSIAEMSYEEILRPEAQTLELRSGVRYSFQAWTSIWGFLRIEASSLLRHGPEGSAPAVDAAQFFIDAQAETGMSDIVLANFLEEMHRTLFADLGLLRRQAASRLPAMLELSGEELQSLLDGHPKILLNKGRMSWSVSDHARYAPESLAPFRLVWVAVQKAGLAFGWDEGLSERELLERTMGERESARLLRARSEAGLAENDYSLLPLHPWQWENVVQMHFAADLAKGRIVPLGDFGDRYLAQTSLRTLSNFDHPERYQLKLALSLLNTSCVRGIPSRTLAIAPRLSAALAGILEKDPLFREAGTKVLREPVGLSYQHPAYQKVQGAPYRYHEYLGAIWRDSPVLVPGEKLLLTASLFQKDGEGQLLLSGLLRLSGKTLESWIKLYCEKVVVPLYHLQARYGIGIVAHGQNTMLLLKDGVPAGLVLKDLQGDFRILNEDIPELAAFDSDIKARLTRLPAHYLIHDLQTAHFVTVLRFLSAALQEHENFPELRFYQILAASILDYQARFPELAERFQAASLLEAKIPRILLNKVRMRIGYADSAERPLPELGSELDNPLYLALTREDREHASDL